MSSSVDLSEQQRVAWARVAEVAGVMSLRLDDIARALQEEISESIPELRGDQVMVDLLHASLEANVKTFFHLAQYGVDAREVAPPWPAVEYARRLAQRGISSNALLRAYRLGQRRVTDWISAELGRREPDGTISFIALQLLQGEAFTYVDRVSELVVAEYEVERERWLANRNTIRSTMLATLLSDDDTDVDSAVAEQALGYRLRQHHVGVFLWGDERRATTSQLQRLEQLLGAIADALGADGSPLFMPQDRALGWGWIPLGPTSAEVAPEEVSRVVLAAGEDLRAALGTGGHGLSGFRRTHVEARRTRQVAVTGAGRSAPATSYGEPGVRAAALLAGDLSLTRDLVTSTLGGLARDDEGVERLRDTLLTFLSEKGSYVATAEKVHLHKNTVKYRVDKAVELRGRPVDEDRFNLELALIACRWLGAAVLT